MKLLSQISIEHVAGAARKVHSMSQVEKIALADEVFEAQPNLLASCLAQPRLGVAMESVEFLLNILFVCFEAMKGSGHRWPVISENVQERQMARLVGTVKFTEDLADTALADSARAQYLVDHPERPLLTFVLGECRTWLSDRHRRPAGSESDKFVMIAAINMVNCIAAVGRPERA
ncbi:MAG: hypothetical protein WDO56_36625 [Gammaproteobacteria bacterium]